MVGVVLDAVGQLVPLVPALVAEELPVDCHVTEVAVVLVTAVLAVVPAVTPELVGDALLCLLVEVVDGEDLVPVLILALELALLTPAGPAAPRGDGGEHEKV